MACRHLMKGQDFFPAEQILAQYLPVLESLMQQPSKYQQVAAHLALQGDILSGILALHQLRPADRERHCQHGIGYSHLIDDQSLQATVHINLASTFFYLADSRERCGNQGKRAVHRLQRRAGSIHVHICHSESPSP